MEDRGQVKLKHGAEEKQRPRAPPPSLSPRCTRQSRGTARLNWENVLLSKKKKKSNLQNPPRLQTDSSANRRLLVCSEEEGAKVACLRVRASVQSGTVSVLLHPRCGLEVFTVALLWSTSTTRWMGGRVTLSVCIRVLFSAPNWRSTAPSATPGQSVTLIPPLSCPPPSQSLPKKSASEPDSTDSVHSFRKASLNV